MKVREVLDVWNLQPLSWSYELGYFRASERKAMARISFVSVFLFLFYVSHANNYSDYLKAIINVLKTECFNALSFAAIKSYALLCSVSNKQLVVSLANYLR